MPTDHGVHFLLLTCEFVLIQWNLEKSPLFVLDGLNVLSAVLLVDGGEWRPETSCPVDYGDDVASHPSRKILPEWTIGSNCKIDPSRRGRSCRFQIARCACTTWGSTRRNLAEIRSAEGDCSCFRSRAQSGKYFATTWCCKVSVQKVPPDGRL
jgi:hypothetical protein